MNTLLIEYKEQLRILQKILAMSKELITKKYLPVLFAQTLQKLEFEDNDSFMNTIMEFYKDLNNGIDEVKENVFNNNKLEAKNLEMIKKNQVVLMYTVRDKDRFLKDLTKTYVKLTKKK